MSKNTPINSPFSPVPPPLRPAVAIRDFLRAGEIVKKGDIIEVTEKEFNDLFVAKAVRSPTQFDELKNKTKEIASAFLPNPDQKQKPKKGK